MTELVGQAKLAHHPERAAVDQEYVGPDAQQGRSDHSGSLGE